MNTNEHLRQCSYSRGEPTEAPWPNELDLVRGLSLTGRQSRLWKILRDL